MERTALVIEDDSDIRGLIEHTLTSQGFTVSTAEDGPAGVEAALSLDPDLITLDLGLPGFDGIEACRRIRQHSDAYVVMISARRDEIDKLIGLETGADDFMVKPFSPRELRARVSALFRRPRRTTQSGSAQIGTEQAAPVAPSTETPTAEPAAQPDVENEVLRHGVIAVDVDARQVWVDEVETELTRIEFDLLTELVRRPGRVWSREALLRTVWGNEWASDTHLVEVHVGNLRKKLGEQPDRRFIRTVRGVGYRMETPA
ncbi:response regulator transcription factor [Nocardioides sp. Root140]|uniref:response regulator transcription factor n=1 Tax=Nocardioides sp. Root140 TaxID=1736460 RepID=UPI0006F782F3|nr:response regulator transcription factor [Nocardioides sp. Root140]KQY64715.1 PhoR family transcriptional regulator [Nocardioides sp. Root140]